jgi:6,7-dimethyl-8-ribityllumazine synthase
MLKAVRTKSLRADKATFAIVASRYNARYVDAMVRAAQAELRRAGARRIQVVRVPGAYEIPVVAARLARSAARSAENGARLPVPNLSAIICLGVILRGETAHAALIGDAISRGLMTLQLRYEIPVIHEVLLLENAAQAHARCLNRKHNRGTEAAQTAIAISQIMAALPV